MSFQVGQQVVVGSFGNYRIAKISKKVNQHSVLVDDGFSAVSMRTKDLFVAELDGFKHGDKVRNKRTDEIGIVNYFNGTCANVTVLTKSGFPSVPGVWPIICIEKTKDQKNPQTIQSFQIGDVVNTNPAHNDQTGSVIGFEGNGNVKVSWIKSKFVTSYDPRHLMLVSRVANPVVAPSKTSKKFDHKDAKALYEYNIKSGWPNKWEYSHNGKEWYPTGEPLFREYLQYRLVKDQANLVPPPVPNASPELKNSHPHAKHILEWATREVSGQPNVWESRVPGFEWSIDRSPTWVPEFEYRLRTGKEFFVTYNEQEDAFTKSLFVNKADLKIVMKDGKIASVEILNKEKQ